MAHNSHKGDQAAFLRSGGSTLFPEELELLGDVAGRSLLHLQCNAGQDSLSLARLGAEVTGVDISDEAIDFARRLSADSGIAACFERADIFDWLEEAARAGRSFDRVFSSYGAILWLSDIPAWARGIAGVLKPGGRFVLVEFHPLVLMFDQRWQPRYDYFGGTVVEEPGVGDYVAESGGGVMSDGKLVGVKEFQNPHRSYEFSWGLADVVSALLAAGLRLERLTEYPYANDWRGFERMADIGGRRMVPPEDMPRIPLMYGVVASKPA